MRAVLFDLDGTLVDTRALYAVSYQRAFEEVLDTPPTWEDLIARTPTSERHFLLDWFGPEVGGRIHDVMVRTYREEAARLFKGFFPGVAELLDELTAREVRLGIVTGKSRAAFDVTRELIDLDRFEAVVVEEDVTLPKPHPAGVIAALERLGVEPRDAIYVGDLPMDVEAGRRAGARAAAAVWARERRFEVEGEPPPWLTHPSELLALL